MPVIAGRAMHKLNVVKIGANHALILNDEVCATLGLKEGDSVYLAETTDGYRIVGRDPREQRQTAVARAVMARRRTLLRRLAE